MAYYTVKDVAAQLSVTTHRVQALCKQRRIKGARMLGRQWAIPVDYTITPGKRGPKCKQPQ